MGIIVETLSSLSLAVNIFVHLYFRKIMIAGFLHVMESFYNVILLNRRQKLILIDGSFSLCLYSFKKK